MAQTFIVVSGIVAARALGVEGRGTLALLWLLPVTLALLGGLGIPQATTFFVARGPGSSSRTVRMSANLTLVIAGVLCVLYGVGLALAGSGGKFSAVEGLLSVSLLPFLLAQNLAIATLLGLKRYTAFNLGRLAPTLAYALSTLLLFIFGLATLGTILAACVGSWALGSMVTWILVRRGVKGADGAPGVDRSELVGFGLRGVIGTVSPVDDVRIDQLFVGFLLDPRALGLYVSAVAFTNLPRFVAQSIGSVNYPRIASAGDAVASWVVARRAAGIGVAAIAITVAGLIAAIPFLLPLLFGEEFQDAVDIAYVLLLRRLLPIHSAPAVELARGLGHPGYGSITELVNLAVFLLGCWFSSPPRPAPWVSPKPYCSRDSRAPWCYCRFCSRLRRNATVGGFSQVNENPQSEHYGDDYDYLKGSPHLRHRHLYEHLTGRSPMRLNRCEQPIRSLTFSKSEPVTDR